jgi:sigma-E factor negative regulatory protein RseC
MNETVQHTGVIEKIEPPVVFVRIVQQSACSECHANSFCPASARKIKTVEVEDHTGSFLTNEEVLVCGRSAMGMQAVALAFVLPLLIMTVTLAAGIKLTGNELISGLSGLLVLLPYYGLIYLMRDKLKKKFVFTLSKIK